MKIKIKNLKAMVSLGCYEWEKKQLRPVIIDVEVTIDASFDGASDSINDTIDYDAIAEKIIEIAKSRHFNLVEHMVWQVLEVMGNIKGITHACVEIDKPGAIEAAESVSIKEERVF